MICEVCHGSGWRLHCPEKRAGCPFQCSAHCRFGTCEDCGGSGVSYCCSGDSACNDAPVDTGEHNAP